MLLDLSKPRFDQSTYFGRLCHFSQITNPLNLLASSTTLEQSKKLLEQYKSGLANVDTSAEAEKVWKAKYLVDATYHPDTGDKIFLPFRMSAFVPVNLILVAGMLMPNPSMKSVVFWQLMNQSANVAFNYSNANKTTEMNLSETAFAYAAAVTTSVGIALGLNHGVKRLPPSIGPTTRTILSRMIPFTAVVAAGTVNVFLMRMKEIRDGIQVTDEEGMNHGKSKKAGLSAVTQVAVSRCVSSIPVMLFPPFALSFLERTSLLRGRPGLVTPVNFGLIAASLLTALPASVAIFPQRPLVTASSLEAQFHNLKDSSGRPIEKLLFNKGL